MIYISHPKDKGTSLVLGCKQDSSGTYSKEKQNCDKP